MNIQQLRAQIAALQDATMDKNKNFRSAYDEGKFDALSAVDSLLDSLQEEPVSRTPADIEAAMQDVEEKSRAFTEAHHGEVADTILAQMRGEEPVSEDLEEAASAYAREEYNIKNPSSLPQMCIGCYAPLMYAFKACANWQKEDKLFTETKIEKELAECYLRVFDKKFALPKIKGKQLHDFKNFINTCEQTFSMKYFDYHATQGKLFERLALLWAVWGAEHLNDIHINDKLEDVAKKLWSELNTGHSYSVIDSYNIFYGVCVDVANWQREQMIKNVPDDVEEAANEYLCGCKSRVASYEKKGFIAGAQWQAEQFEKNRLKHCDELTEEQAQMESDFVTQHLKENNRTPTFIDAIEYGMRLNEEQTMKDATECEVKVDAGGYPYIDRCIELYDYDKDVPLAKAGDKYKVVLIKEG